MTKKQLRHIYKMHRRHLSPNQKLGLEARLFERLRNSIDLVGKTVHTFLPITKHHEIDTYPLLQHREVRWVVSKSNFETNTMQNFLFEPEMEIVKSDWGIPEPVTGNIVAIEEIDTVLTPLLCFDLKGIRVGYGKGFYDRFLASCRDDVEKIGIGLFEAVESIDDAADHDIRLTAGITPKNVYYF